MGNLLAGQNAFITGAGANIGRAIALEMAEQGANIFFADIDPARVAALEGELRHKAARVQGFVADLSGIAAIEAILAQLKQGDIAIHILVNNLGLTVRAPETTPESFARWQRVFDINVLVPLYLSRLVAQSMIEAQIAGSIVFITSVHQWTYFGDQIYSATKASLGLIVEELAVALSPHNIRVNGIAPGRVGEAPDGTPLFHRAMPLYHEQIRPQYIGRAAVFLASDYFSHHTTGAILKVDGGISLFSFDNRNIMMPPPPVSAARSWVRRQRQRWNLWRHNSSAQSR